MYILGISAFYHDSAACIIKDNEIVQGSPAFSISDYKRAYVYFRQLPKLNSLVNRIEKEVNKILSK